MKDRPFSITLISGFFILGGILALGRDLQPMLLVTAAERIADLKSHWMVHLAHVTQIVSGIFLLRGHNWARWVLVVWIGFHIAISVLHSAVQFAVHVLIFSVILFFLFRRPASEFLAR